MTNIDENAAGLAPTEAESHRLRTLLILAAGLAHEVNNALSAALGFTEMALEELEPGNQARGDLEDALGALDRSSLLVRQFLALCRPTPEPQTCLALNPLVKEAGKQGWLGMETGRISLEVPAELLMVRADPVALFKAISDLCEFASRTCPSSGKCVVVRLEKSRQAPAPGLQSRGGWACLSLDGRLEPPPADLVAAWRQMGGGLQRIELAQDGARLLAWLPLAEDSRQGPIRFT